MKKLLTRLLVTMMLLSVLPVTTLADTLAERYEAAEVLMVEGEYLAAADAFDALMTYSDASYMAMYCRAVNAGESGLYSVAVEAFASLGEFKDSAKMAKYYTAREYQDAGTLSVIAEATDDELEAAIANLKTAQQYYSEQVLFKDSTKRSNDCGDQIAAIEEVRFAASKGELWAMTIGSYVTFGNYEQDNNVANGAEPIEWLVLDIDEVNHRALLLSRYGLDAKPHNVAWAYITWEECTLRTWLNKDFLNAAFTASEQSAILTTAVDNSKSQGYSEWDTDGGNNTQDQIFLLSYAEAHQYLGVEHSSYYKDSSGNYNYTNITSRVSPTAYAIQNGAFTSSDYQTAEGTAAGWWWLRSPGHAQDYAAFVYFDGSLFSSRYMDINRGVVRPAFWLNLDSDFF